MASEDCGPVHLKDDQTVARCAIQPKYLQDGVFSPLALLMLASLDEKKVKKKRYAISVASRTLLPATIDVHEYGCRTAAFQNKQYWERTGEEVPADKRSHYRGFYELNVGEIRSVKNSAYQILVVNHPENGENAHCEIRFLPNIELDKNDLSMARTQMIATIADLALGPERHLCEADAEFAEQLAQAPIPELAGPVATAETSEDGAAKADNIR